MNIEIEHITTYQYSDQVNLSPHYLYLSPHLSPFQSILSHRLDIFPTPSALIKNLDQESNIQHLAYFNTPTSQFSISSRICIESNLFDTLNFVFYPFSCAKLPFTYPAKLALYVNLALKQKKVNPEIKVFAMELMNKVKFDTMDFLMELTAYIKSQYLYNVRMEGDPMPAISTFHKKEGSCRDFVVLMMDICAAAGILSRFVSGYFVHDLDAPLDLHAWIEVLLPGGGWRGFDPTEGNPIDVRYVALAKSIEPRGLVPIRGSFKSAQIVEVGYQSSIQKITHIY